MAKYEVLKVKKKKKEIPCNKKIDENYKVF